MNEPWESEADLYRDLLTTSCEEVHFGVGIPGNRELRLVEPAELGQRALDLGCGSGENLVALTRLGYQVTGVEPSGRQLRYAQKLLVENDAGATLLELSAERVDEVENYFDIILSVGTLHFCPDISRVFQSIAERLNPAGRFIVSMPHPLDMLSEYSKGDDGLIVRVGSYFPSGQRLRGARYWRKFGGSKATGYEFDEYVYTIGGLATALLDGGFRIRKLLEPECTHNPAYPCLFRSPDAVFEKEYSRSVPQYLIIVADREP